MLSLLLVLLSPVVFDTLSVGRDFSVNLPDKVFLSALRDNGSSSSASESVKEEEGGLLTFAVLDVVLLSLSLLSLVVLRLRACFFDEICSNISFFFFSSCSAFSARRIFFFSSLSLAFSFRSAKIASFFASFSAKARALCCSLLDCLAAISISSRSFLSFDFFCSARDNAFIFGLPRALFCTCLSFVVSLSLRSEPAVCVSPSTTTCDCVVSSTWFAAACLASICFASACLLSTCAACCFASRSLFCRYLTL